MLTLLIKSYMIIRNIIIKAIQQYFERDDGNKGISIRIHRDLGLLKA